MRQEKKEKFYNLRRSVTYAKVVEILSNFIRTLVEDFFQNINILILRDLFSCVQILFDIEQAKRISQDLLHFIFFIIPVPQF